jgi:hypothetical protein
MFFMVLDKEFARRLVEKFKKSPEISPCDKDHPGSPIKDTAGPSTSVSLPDIAATNKSHVTIYIYEFKTFILTKLLLMFIRLPGRLLLQLLIVAEMSQVVAAVVLESML